jgi:hypothetical protein
MISTSISSKGYLAVALGMGVAGTSPVHASEAFFMQSYGWLSPITSYSKGNVLSSKSSRVAPSLTAKEMVVQLRDEGLPVAAIAEITGVERKTVYAWLSGGAVRPYNDNRIKSVFKLLQSDQQADLRSLYRFWNRKFENGSSLSTAFQETLLDEDDIRSKLAELWPLAKKQQSAKNSSSSGDLKNNSFLRDSREVGLSLDA